MNIGKRTSIKLTLNLPNNPPWAKDDMLFHDKSNSQSVMAVETDILLRGSLLNILCEISSLSNPSSLKRLSGRNRKRLCEKSTILK